MLEERDQVAERHGLAGGDGIVFGNLLHAQAQQPLEVQDGGDGQRGRQAGDDGGVGLERQIEAREC